MAKNTKTLRVAVAGATASDGRTIEASWLSDIAETYNTKTYGARCWIEHIRSTFAEGLFPAVGDVLSVFTKTEKINGENRLCLYATIKALPQLLTINKSGQKIYSSIEVEPNFAKTGKAYLMGLAFTDSPASIGTEALKFNSHAQKHPNNVFTEACETELFDTYEHAVAFAKANPDALPLLERISELEAQNTCAQFTANPVPAVTAPVTAPATTPAAVHPFTTAVNQTETQPTVTQPVAQVATQPTDFNQLFAQFAQTLDEKLDPLAEKISALEAFKTQVEQTVVDAVPAHDGNFAGDKDLAEY